MLPGSGGTCQHLGDKNKRIPESSRPAWSTKQVPEQLKLHRVTLSRKAKKSSMLGVQGDGEVG